MVHALTCFDSDARVLIVQSLVKGVFCAGADLKVSVWGKGSYYTWINRTW